MISSSGKYKSLNDSAFTFTRYASTGVGAGSEAACDGEDGVGDDSAGAEGAEINFFL